MSDEDGGSCSETGSCSEYDDELSQEDIQTKGKFHGVYLLVSRNQKFKGRTYVGYTVNPNRRIKQHNGGKSKGGARQTSGRGPWNMVLIVHGFPNDITALRFEWAWQHPSKSRRLKDNVTRRTSKETSFQFKMRILSHMLCVGPWHRLPLTIRWLKQEYEEPFPHNRQPPLHMPISHGLVNLCEANKIEKDLCDHQGQQQSVTCKVSKGNFECQLCEEDKLENLKLHISFVHCYHKHCTFAAHITCFAAKICPLDQIIPVSGYCPLCHKILLWGELVKRVK